MDAVLTASPEKEKPVSAAKKTGLFYWVPTAVFLIGISSIVLLLWVNRIHERSHVDGLITGALMDFQIKIAIGHLWLEEYFGGDDTADQALAEIDQAIDLINVAVNGGPTEHGLIPEPLKDPELRSHGEALRSMLVNIKMLAQDRLGNHEEAGIASDLDQQFDSAFMEILGKARVLEAIITKTGAEEQVKSERLFLGIISAWVFILIITVVGLWSRESRRKSAEEALLKAHAQLLAQTAELTEHRERLAELVEIRTAELTRTNELLLSEIDERNRMEGQVLQLNEELELKVEERTKQLLTVQEELVRGEKLAVLGRLSGCVGHELRNPLGVMSNAVYFLKTVLADADETTKEYLDIIKNEIDTSLRIITDLLGFARTRAPQIEVVTARKLIDESLGRCTIPEDLAVQVDLADNLPPLKVDPLQIGQVMQNLITNGIQAMPAGGTLSIRGELDNEGMIGLEIADTGEGISPENMEKLFQPLFTTKAKGIGLGLVVCKNLVEANGGRIEVKSKPGAGTTLTIRLPVER